MKSASWLVLIAYFSAANAQAQTVNAAMPTSAVRSYTEIVRSGVPPRVITLSTTQVTFSDRKGSMRLRYAGERQEFEIDGDVTVPNGRLYRILNPDDFNNMCNDPVQWLIVSPMPSNYPTPERSDSPGILIDFASGPENFRNAAVHLECSWGAYLLNK